MFISTFWAEEDRNKPEVIPAPGVPAVQNEAGERHINPGAFATWGR